MKKIKISGLVIMLLGINCAPKIGIVPFSEKTYPSTNEIQIFKTKPPQEYIEIGEITINKPLKVALPYLKEKGMQMGGDGIIITDENKVCPSLNNPKGVNIIICSYEVKAVIIKFKQEDEQDKINLNCPISPNSLSHAFTTSITLNRQR